MTTLEEVTAAGGVIFREQSRAEEPQVVLIFRRGVWDLPKGKLEPDEAIRECAVREVSEELGLPFNPAIVAGLIDTYHEYEMDKTRFGKTTHWYAMAWPSAREITFKPQSEEGIEKVEWYSLSDARHLVGYANLVKVLKSFEQWLNNRSL